MTKTDKAELWLRIGVAVLLVVLFVQCGQYFALYRHLRRNSEAERFDMRSLTLSAQSRAASFDTDLLLPDVAVVRTAEGARAIRNSDAVVEELFASALPSLRAALAVGFQDAGDFSELPALLGSDCLYLHFTGELPLTLFRVLLSVPADDGEDETAPFGVSHVLLLPDGNGRIARVCFASAEGVHTVVLGDASQRQTYESVFAQYADSFAACTMNVTDTDVSTVITDRVLVRRLVPDGNTAFLLRQDAADFNAVLRAFSFNPDKLNYHTEPDGTMTCVESHGILRVSADGVAYLATGSGGVSLRGISGSEDAGASLSSYLNACGFLIDLFSDMNRRYVGGDARLVLTSVSATENAGVSFVFRYRFDNVPLRISDDAVALPGLRVTFSRGLLTEFSLYMFSVTRTSRFEYTPMPSWVVCVLGDAPLRELRLVYALNVFQHDEIAAEWAVTFAVPEPGDAEAS